MAKPWPLISSEAVADLGLFKVRRDLARSPRTGQTRNFLVIDMPDWLQLVPVTADGRVVLVRQYRHASRLSGLEVPGGLMDLSDPDAGRAAARELMEETGYGGGEVAPLGVFWPQPAMLANRVHIFAARGVERLAEQDQDEGEDLHVELAAPAEVWDLLARGEIHNAMTVTALLLAQRAGVI